MVKVITLAMQESDENVNLLFAAISKYVEREKLKVEVQIHNFFENGDEVRTT